VSADSFIGGDLLPDPRRHPRVYLAKVAGRPDLAAFDAQNYLWDAMRYCELTSQAHRVSPRLARQLDQLQKPRDEKEVMWFDGRRVTLMAPFARGDLSACRTCGGVFILGHHRQRHCGECGQGVPPPVHTHRTCLAALAGLKPDHSYEITRRNRVYCSSGCRKAVQDYLDGGGWIGYPEPGGGYVYRGQDTDGRVAAAKYRGIAARPVLD
jgi:hypothetical protein